MPRKPKKPGSRTGRPPRNDYLKESSDLLTWASKDDSIILRAWCIDRKISQEELMSWTQESEIFAKAYRQAKTWIGVRREQLALKQGNGAPYSRYAAVYDKVLKEHEAEIRADSTVAQTQIVLVDKGSLDRAEIQTASKIKAKTKEAIGE